MRILLLVLLAANAWAVPSQLWLRGYSVIPAPRTVNLDSGDRSIDGSWTVDAGSLRAGHIALSTLLDGLQTQHRLSVGRGPQADKTIRLAITPGTVATKSDPAIDAQAYRIRIAAGRIDITGNSDAGLFYGVQTLLQLLKRNGPDLTLPLGTIEDWPRLQLRFLHWDTKHHQDRMETLKRYLDEAARMKVNMIGFELEDKFEYPSHPVIGAPGAFTTAELQEIVDYGLARFIQVVPVVQSPAHMAYVLKHPEFAHLRADGNNYQSALCDPGTYELIFSMYDDVIRATRGVDYLFVSTDEVYYAGIEGCKPYTPENRSLAWAEFVRKARDFGASRGRRILVWAEYPLLPQHVKLIPPDVIDGVIGEQDYLESENKLGMRQLAYVSMQGAELLFPDHLPDESGPGRIRQAFDSIAGGRHWQGKPIGVFGAAWDDSGLHSETFWLGWSAAAQYGWNPGAVTADQHIAEFMQYYYGPRVQGMTEIYRMMQRQARAWERTWERVTSRVRGPGYGNSYGKGVGTQRTDMTLPPPALPQLPDLRMTPVFSEKFAGFVAEARERAAESDQLVSMLQENFGRAGRNRYNLEVFLALAKFMDHHWRLLMAMNEAEIRLARARDAAGSSPQAAARNLLAAYSAINTARKQGAATFAELTATFEKSRFPKGRTVNGRKFVHVLDDVKDHWADRTVDLSYMTAPEASIRLDEWQNALGKVIAAYAEAHKIDLAKLGGAPRLEE